MMKGLILSLSFIAALGASKAQDITIKLKSGEKLDARASANTSTQLLTDQGNINYVDVDSLTFHGYESSYDNLKAKLFDHGIKVSVSENRSAKPVFVSAHPDYIEDLPFNEQGELVFQEVVSAEHDKEQLYLLSKLFFTKVFKSADDVIQFDDEETATVIGKGFSEILIETGFSPVTTRMYYTITLQSKDKRYKYEISDVYFKSYPSTYASSIEVPASEMFQKKHYYKKNGNVRTVMQSYHDETLRTVSLLIIQLVDVMNFTKPVSDDW